jgi:hypothetical protein
MLVLRAGVNVRNHIGLSFGLAHLVHLCGRKMATALDLCPAL